MIRGNVNARLEAKLRLTIIGPTGIRQVIDAVIDTGFYRFFGYTVRDCNSIGTRPKVW